MSRRASLWVMVSICLPAAGSIHAAIYTYTDGDTTGLWSDSANWSPAGPPTASDDALFDGGAGGPLYNAYDAIALPNGVTSANNMTIMGNWSFWSFTNASATLQLGGNLTFMQSFRGLAGQIDPVVDITGQVITGPCPENPTGEAGGLTFSANGNTFAGGFNIGYGSVQAPGNDTTVGGTITVQGTDWLASLQSQGGITSVYVSGDQSRWGRAGGCLYFGGTGNNYSGLTTINLNADGCVDFASAANTPAAGVTADLSGVTSINFNGGTLQLEGEYNDFAAMPGGFDVVSGTLWVATNDSLGTAANIIQLGGPNSLGMLTGYTYDEGDHAITHNIVLNGQGGVIRAYQDGSIWIYDRSGVWTDDMFNQFNIASTISGSGALIKIGNVDTELENGTAITFTPNTYGDTVVAGTGRLIIDTNRSVGTGNVTVCAGGELSVYGANAFSSMAPGKTVLLEGGAPGSPSILDVLDPNVAPVLDPNCNGVLALGGYISLGDSSPIAIELAAGIKGDGTNGQLFLGGSPAWGGAGLNVGTLAPGSPLTPGGNDTYRFGGTAWNNEMLYVNGNCLVGNTDVLLKEGGVQFTGSNTFTGALTIQESLSSPDCQDGEFWGFFDTTSFGRVMAFTRSDSDATQSSIGAATGNVNLMNGDLQIYGTDGGLIIQKAGLSINGTGVLSLYGLDTTSLTQVGFTSLTRVNRGDLMIMSTSAGLGAAGTEKFFIGGTTTDSTGMVAPYIVAANGAGTGSFLTYDSTNGFTMAPFVAMPSSGGDGTAIAQTSGAALTGNVSVNALRADGPITGIGLTVTINSGGLILTGSASSPTVHTANFQFGATGTAEAVIFANSSYASQLIDPTPVPELDGQLITTGGLTKTGQGVVRMGTTATDRTGSLVGPITINQGGLVVNNDANLGASTNPIVLNGGSLIADNNAEWTYAQIDINNTIEVGPNGGTVISRYNGLGAFNFNAPFQDLVAGQSGPICFTMGDMAPGIFAPSPNFSGGAIIQGYVSMRAGGTLGTGPITVTGTLYNWSGDYTDPSTGNPYVLDQSGSRMTILGTGLFYIASGDVELGSLAGDGTIQFGHPSDGYGCDKTLTVGYDNTNADFYGTMTGVEYMDTVGGDFHRENLVKVGTGVQTLWGNLGYYGNTTIDGGTLQINGLLGGGGVVVGNVTVNSSGTLGGNGTILRGVNVNAGGTLAGALLIGADVTSAGAIDGIGTINGDVTSTGSINAGGTINGNLFANGGTVAGATAVNGNVTIAGATVTGGHAISGNLAISSGSFTADPGTTIGGTLYVSGTGAYAGSSAIAGTAELDAGTISGTHAIGGNYTQNGGVFSGTSAFGAAGSPVAVAINGGAFQGNHTIYGSFATSPGSNAVVATHNGATAGTLTVVGNVSLDASTTLDFNLGTPGTVGGGINDLIDITGSLSLDGTLNVTGLTGFSTGTYTLFTYTGTLTEPSGPLTLGAMPSGMGYTYTISTATAGQVNLDVVLPYAPGDTNHDGVLNSLDIDAIYHNFGAPATSQWKVDGDGNVVGQGDVTYELHTYFHTNYGDANLDTKTDFTDFQVLLDHWQVSGPTVGWAQGDFNGSYSVDFLDFQTLLDYWNPGGWSFGQQAPAQTPEPAMLTLLLLGGLALLRRRK